MAIDKELQKERIAHILPAFLGSLVSVPQSMMGNNANRKNPEDVSHPGFYTALPDLAGYAKVRA